MAFLYKFYEYINWLASWTWPAMFETKIFIWLPRIYHKIFFFIECVIIILLGQGQILLAQLKFLSPGMTGRPLVLNSEYEIGACS